MLRWSLVGMIATAAVVAGCSGGLQLGHALFTTADIIGQRPISSYLNSVAQYRDEGYGSECGVDQAVTSVPLGTPVYAIYVLNARVVGRDDAVLAVTKNGLPFALPTQMYGSFLGDKDPGIAQHDWGPIANNADCLYDGPNEAWTLGPGQWHFQVSYNGQVVSAGDLTVGASDSTK